MALTVDFFQVSKRKNSTFVPEESAIQKTEKAVLKEGCGVLSPTLILHFPYSANPYVWNFVRIREFKRFYWVVEWTVSDGVGNWELSLNVDVLASYRDVIAQKNFYIERCSVASNGDIIDLMYPATAKQTFATTKQTMWDDSNWSGGTFVCCILGKNGLVNYYLFKTEAWKNVIKSMFSSTDWMKVPITDIPEAVLKAAVNPGQYMLKCFWLPMTVETEFIPANIDIGWWEIAMTGQAGNTSCILDNQALISKTLTFETTVHPQSARGSYLNNSPYTRGALFSHVFGYMPIDMNSLDAGNSFNVSVIIDPRTGICELRAYQGNTTLALASKNISCPITVGNITDDTVSLSTTATNAVSGLVNLISGGFDAIGNENKSINGDVLSREFLPTGLGANIGNALNSLRGKSVVKSGDGSLINSLGSLWFEQEFSHVVDYNNGMFGKPYCSTGKMADLGTGFYLIKNGSIGLEFAFESEINQVREWLERGVYYA